ncbi:hypothetical protein [Clostridium sp. CF012]|nr:hypothetical protein [Clostridium sp. CF012]MBU3142787.1 hypothetical protein [Clostridium sp. CF012]
MFSCYTCHLGLLLAEVKKWLKYVGKTVGEIAKNLGIDAVGFLVVTNNF